MTYRRPVVLEELICPDGHLLEVAFDFVRHEDTNLLWKSPEERFLEEGAI